EADGTLRVGRVAVRAADRGRGLGGRVMRASIALAREIDERAEIHVDAQAYLEGWYQGLGFETVGELFDEAGIEHVPMLLRPERGGARPGRRLVSPRRSGSAPAAP